MTRDDIIRIAREVGMAGMLTDVVCTITELKHFAALIAAAERETIIQLIDEMRHTDRDGVIDAIRARG